MMLSVLAIAAHGDQSRRQCLILKYLSSQSGFDKHIQNHQGDTVLSMARRLYLFEVLDILGGGDDDEKLGWGSEEVKSSLEPLSPSKQLTALQFLKSIGNVSFM